MARSAWRVDDRWFDRLRLRQQAAGRRAFPKRAHWRERFGTVAPDKHRFGSVTDSIDRAKQATFLDEHHIANKTDCATCWARPICGGGCYHEAHTRYGATTQPNLHYCEWIRGWTHTCLEIYGELAVKNPGFLRQFDGDDDEAPQRH